MNTNYQHDLFVSFHTPSVYKDWLLHSFLPVIKTQLQLERGETKLFFFPEQMRPGLKWPQQLKEGLAYSRCLISLWCPGYFQSEWCLREWRTMVRRERELKISLVGQRAGLVVPIVIGDGDTFPDEAKKTEWIDVKDYVIDGPGFRETKKYVEFQEKIKEWIPRIVKAIEMAPPWQETWLTERFPKVKPVPVLHSPMPTLD